VYLMCRICAVLFACILLSGTIASAGDYTLIYAIDANGKNDAGKIETCEYSKPCGIEPPGFGLMIFLSFIRPGQRSVELHVYGRPGCCYSADAATTIYVDITPDLLRVPLYEGRKRRGNEFVQNKKFGVLYLEFSNMR